MNPIRLALLALLLTTVQLAAQPAIPPAEVHQTALSRPSFIENRGQWRAPARFLMHAPGLDAWVGSNGITYDYFHQSPLDSLLDGRRSIAVRRTGHVIAMRFVDGAGAALAYDEDARPGLRHYLHGGDSTKWVRGVRQFDRVTIEHIYSGVDARIASEGNGLRYDLVVRPAGDAGRIRIAFDGAESVSLTPTGDLAIGTTSGDVLHRGLVAFQERDGRREKVTCAFVPNQDGTVGFAVGTYDRTRPLIIDPLVYSTYLGGSGECFGGSVAADPQGNAYLFGVAFGADYPLTPGAYDTTFADTRGDLVVTKLNPTGTALVYSTVIGGDSAEGGGHIQVDRHGNAYIVAVSFSTNYPLVNALDSLLVRNPATDTVGPPDAVVSKLDSSGSRLVFSTFLGGLKGSEGQVDLAVDDSGFVHVSGVVDIGDFPVTPGALFTTFRGGYTDGFVARLSQDGSRLVFGTYLGGSGDDYITSIAVDWLGRVYVGGFTHSSDFPITRGVLDTTLTGIQDAFVSRLGPFGNALMTSTYLGGSAWEGNVKLACDNDGAVYLAGTTGSTDFPVTTNAYQSSYRSQYAAKLNPDFKTLYYATFLGGSGGDQPWAVSLGKGGFLGITGVAGSTNYPTTADAFSRTKTGVSDAFATVVRPSGGTLAYSSYIGGRSAEQGYGIAFDPRANLYIGGTTTSDNFPVSATAFDRTANGGTDFYLAKIGRCALAFNLGPDKVLCSGDTTNIGVVATGGVPEYQYEWVTTDTTVLRGAVQQRVAPATTTVYVVNVQDLLGCLTSDTVVVVVNPRPIAVAGPDTAVCVGTPVRIGGVPTIGTPPFTYLWTPATGLDSPSVAMPLARSTSSMQYQVRVTDAAGCIAYDTVVVTINNPPVIEKGSRIEICPGDTATLGVTISQGVGPFTYRWTPTTGISNPTTANPRANPAATTTYFVTVTDANGCSTRSDSVTVHVGSTLKTRIQVTGSLRLCAGASVTLSAGTFARYRWSTGDTTASITVNTPGSYSVAIESASGCSGFSDTVVVATGQTVDPSFSGPTVVCVGSESMYLASAPNAANWAWRIAGSAGSIVSSSLDSVHVQWFRAGVDTLILVTTSRDGCLDSSKVAVTARTATRPTLVGTPGLILCEGASTSLDAGDYASYRWSTGETARRITVTVPGLYWAEVTDAAGCTARSDTVAVVVRANPRPSVTTSSMEVCAGDSIELVGPPGYVSYQWSDGRTTRSIWVRSTGTFSLTVVDSAGCRGTSPDLALVVNPAPSVPTITSSGDTLIASAASAWQWLRDGAEIPGADARRFVRRESGSYAVRITDSNGCTATSAPFFSEQRLVWIDTVSARLGQRVRLGVHIAPPLRAGDGVTSLRLRVHVKPSDLFFFPAIWPSRLASSPVPQTTTSIDGTVIITASARSPIEGDTLMLLYVEGLSTGRPESPVYLDSASIGGVGLASVAGDGLVLLSGCDIGRFAVGKRVRFIRIERDGLSITVTYRAPIGSHPDLRLVDVAGRTRLTMPLTEGTDADQRAQIDAAPVGSGMYLIELSDRDERAALPMGLIRGAGTD